MLCIARKHLNYLTSRSLRSTKLLLLSNIICLQKVTPLHKLSTTLMRLKIFAPRDYLKSLLPFISKQDKKKNSQWCRFRANYLLSLGKLNSFVEFSQKVTFSACRFNFVQEEHYDQKSVSITKYRRHFRFVFKFMILWKYLEEKNIWKERRIRKKVTLTIFLLFPQ